MKMIETLLGRRRLCGAAIGFLALAGVFAGVEWAARFSRSTGCMGSRRRWIGIIHG